jgi:hypothetical protein
VCSDATGTVSGVGARDNNFTMPLVERLVEQRHAAAAEDVSRLRAEHPDAGRDQLADLLIRTCMKDMALGGAITGGAAASPVAGVAVAAASAGADATWSVSRLGELIMGLGIIYGHEQASRTERAVWVAGILGVSEGAAVGMTGLAARVGARGGARLIARLPAAGAGAARTGRLARAGSTVSRLANNKGPWSIAALVPYGIGAGVGAAGNAALAQAVGRAAKQYFANLSTTSSGNPSAARGPSSTPRGATGSTTDVEDADVIDVEFIEEIILDVEP